MGVHVESEVVETLPVFDTGRHHQLECTVLRIHGGN